MSDLEEHLNFQMKVSKLPMPEREFRFHPKRRWRFDFAWPELKFAVEVEGGVHSGGRHTRGKGFEEDCIKYGEAMKLGWDVYRCSSGLIKSGQALDIIKFMIAEKQK